MSALYLEPFESYQNFSLLYDEKIGFRLFGASRRKTTTPVGMFPWFTINVQRMLSLYFCKVVNVLLYSHNGGNAFQVVKKRCWMERALWFDSPTPILHTPSFETSRLHLPIQNLFKCTDLAGNLAS